MINAKENEKWYQQQQVKVFERHNNNISTKFIKICCTPISKKDVHSCWSGSKHNN